MRQLSNKLTGIELLGLVGVLGTLVFFILLKSVMLVHPAREFLKEDFFPFFFETYTYGLIFLVIQMAGFVTGYLSSEGLSKSVRQRLGDGACMQIFFLFFFAIIWAMWVWGFSYFKVSSPSFMATLLSYIKAAAISYLIVTVILTVVYYINQFFIWGYENYPKTKYILRSLFP